MPRENSILEIERHLRPTSFKASLDSSAENSKSRLILALDLPFNEQVDSLTRSAKAIFEDTADYLCAVKMNFHLIAPLALEDLKGINELISSYGKPSIADVKLNDIDNTNEVAAEYLWSSGFSAVIVNPFVGYDGGLDLLLKNSKERGKGVISLAYMSHRGADEGFGLELKDGRTMYELFLDRAKKWQVDGVIVGSTHLDRIAAARKSLGSEIKIFSPGSGAQGGDPVKSLEAGSDYLIVGRSIVESANPKLEAKRLFDSLLSWKDNRRPL